MRVSLVLILVAVVMIALFGAYFASTSGRPASDDRRISEFHPAPGVVCYAFAGVPQSLSCLRETP